MKSKVLKRVLTIIVATSMLMSITSCGNKSGGGGKTDEGPTKAEDANRDGDLELNEPGQFPLVKGDPVTFSIFTAPHIQECSEFDRDKNVVTKWLEDKLNLRFKWQIVSAADKTSKLNLLFSSKDYPDIIFGSYWDGASQYMYGKQGYLVPMNKYYDGNDAYYYKKYIDMGLKMEGSGVSQAILDNMVMPDGNIYSQYNFNTAYHTKWANRMWIYEPWLKAVGMNMPTTTEEFEAVLKAFKEKDPNGNGKADEIPLAGSLKGWNTDPTIFLMNSFMYYGGVSQQYCYLKDGKVIFAPEQEGYKKGLEYLNKLSTEGLILSDTWTQNANSLKSLTTQSTQLVGCAAGGSIMAFTNGTNRKKGEWTNWKPVPPLKGPSGVQYAMYTPGFASAKFNITNKCKYPKLAFRFGDALYENKIALTVVNGLEGTAWKLAEKNDIGLDGKPAKYIRLDPPVVPNYAWSQISHAANLPGWHTGMAVTCDPSVDNESILYDAASKYSKYSATDDMILPPLVFEGREAKEVVDKRTAINEYLDMMSVQFITKGGIEEGWAEFKKELDNRGAKDLVNMYQKAYDKTKKNKK